MEFDFIELENQLSQTRLPLLYASTYNLTICSDCCIAIPFKWITTHLKENNGLKVNMEKVMKYLNVETPSMSVEEVENWLNEIWILEKPIFGIPIEQGLS